MMTELNQKLQKAEETAFALDDGIAMLHAQLKELVGDLKGVARPYEAGFLNSVLVNLRDSYFRKLGGTLQDMQK